MEKYFTGERLYGDDFSIDQIKVWYDEESEGYANLGSKDKKKYSYAYHHLNMVHGFDYLKDIPSFEHVLGFGSAYVYEFEHIIDRIKKITIIEPSDNLINNKIGNVSPVYVKPAIDGKLNFADNSFDLITCFGTLHHIPNVSFVLEELMRVLQPGGYLLLREPINSMGDWRHPRRGLTKNERGIPVAIFENVFRKYHAEIINKAYCFAMTSPLQKVLNKIYPDDFIFSKKYRVVLDKYLSNTLSWNTHYHRTSFIQKCAPGAVFYVVRKPQ